MSLRLSPISVSLLLAACGGGGSSLVQDTTSTVTPTPTPTQTAPQPSTKMACPSGVASCSGADAIIGTASASPTGVAAADRPAVAYTSSSVQTYGRTTVDGTTAAVGLAPASGGRAEMRLTKDTSGNVTGIALILSNIGISWDGTTERPTILETFRNGTEPGRVQLDANGNVVATTLAAPGTTTFYDHNYTAKTGTQANYANNSYFPRTQPARVCTNSTNVATCTYYSTGANTFETDGIHTETLDWNGTTLKHAWATRRHEDGDIHAGYATANAAVESTGYSVPYAGSKGYRNVDVWSYQYSNLGAWTTQDTVQISEWTTGAGTEHNQVRRGLLAFGDTTDPATIPTTGTATYSNGFAYGWYAASRTVDPSPFNGSASATANFANRTMAVSVSNTNTIATTPATVPAGFTGTLTIGTGNNANYYTGNIASSTTTMSGVASGRFFGPVTNGAPPETGGVYSMTNGTASVMGGFIARKQ